MTILIGEDDPNDSALVVRALRKAGFNGQAQVAENGAEVIRYLQGTGQYNDRAKYPRPDLIILDMRMPQASGLDVLIWCRQQPLGSRAVVVILSSAADPNEVKLVYHYGANAYFEKPTQLAELDEMVRLIYQFWSRAEKPSSEKRRIEPAMSVDGRAGVGIARASSV